MPKFGEHSITSEHVAPEVTEDKEPRAYGSNPFFHEANGCSLRGDSRINYSATRHGYDFIAFPRRRDSSGGMLRNNQLRMTIGGYEDRMKLTIPMIIHFTVPVITSVISMDTLSEYLPGGTPNERSIASSLNPFINNVGLVRGLSIYITNAIQRHDNTALYAKGAFYALLQSRLTQERINTIYAPYPANTPVTLIDLTLPGTTADIIGNHIDMGAFILIQDFDFDSRHLPYVYWLAAGGRRCAPGAAPSIAAMSVTWPPIPFVILHRGVYPACRPPMV